MKILVIGLSLFVSHLAIAQTGFRLNPTEYFTARASVDPTSSINEKGLDILGEVEFVGKGGYVKMGVESFSILQGGYTDLHAGGGITFTSGMYEDWRYYAGVRMACVFRSTGYAVNPGLESGIDFDVLPNWSIGLRGTCDYREEQRVIFNWKPETKFSGFITISYKWYYNNRSPKK